MYVHVFLCGREKGLVCLRCCSGHVRISDLGLAVHIPEGQSVRGRVGTVGYMGKDTPTSWQFVYQERAWGGVGWNV